MTMTTLTLANGRTIEVHPAADLFPMMADAELDELAKDIAKNGLQQPVVYLSFGGVLDGRNRLAAIARIPDEKRRELRWRQAHQGRQTLGTLRSIDPYAYVVSANAHRRHLTAEQKREVIAALLKVQPTKSDRAIAKTAKVDHKTVAAIRAKAEAGGEIPHKDADRTEASGRKARGRKSSAKTSAAEPNPPEPAPPRQAAPPSGAGQLREILSPSQIEQAVDRFAQLLSGSQWTIDSMPLSDRVSIALEILEGLRVTVDDLRHAAPPPPPESPLDDQDLPTLDPDPAPTEPVDLDVLRGDLRRHVSEGAVQSHIATSVDITPGQLNNFLTERRGLSPASAARLDAYLAAQ
jgi:hypothetical protein